MLPVDDWKHSSMLMMSNASVKLKAICLIVRLLEVLNPRMVRYGQVAYQVVIID
jgi:hypothetical protein